MRELFRRMMIVCCAIVLPVVWAEASPLMLADEQGRLSAKMENVLLSEIKKFFEENYGITFSGQEFIYQTNVTVSFEGLKVEQALKRVLKRKNYAFGYNDQGEIVTVTVLPGAGDTPEGAKNSQNLANNALRQRLTPSEEIVQLPPMELPATDEITQFKPVKAEQKAFNVQVVKDNPLFKVEVNSPPSEKAL